MERTRTTWHHIAQALQTYLEKLQSQCKTGRSRLVLRPWVREIRAGQNFVAELTSPLSAPRSEVATSQRSGESLLI